MSETGEMGGTSETRGFEARSSRFSEPRIARFSPVVRFTRHGLIQMEDTWRSGDLWLH
jgi:hypothetical protein